jgi:hypothetical protein
MLLPKPDLWDRVLTAALCYLRAQSPIIVYRYIIKCDAFGIQQ